MRFVSGLAVLVLAGAMAAVAQGQSVVVTTGDAAVEGPVAIERGVTAGGGGVTISTPGRSIGVGTVQIVPGTVSIGEGTGVRTLPGPGPVFAENVAVPTLTVAKRVTMFLGVVASPVPPALGSQLRLPPETGLVVEFVEDGSPAAKAGLKVHDVLTRFNDQILINPAQLAVLVRLQKANDTVTLTFLREGKEQKAPVELVEAERTVNPAAGAIWMQPVLPQDFTRGGLSTPMMEMRQRMRQINSLPPAPGIASVSVATAVISDGHYTLTLTQGSDGKHLLAKDKDGKVVFDGPINTEEELKAVPEPIRERAKNLSLAPGNVMYRLFSSDGAPIIEIPPTAPEGPATRAVPSVPAMPGMPSTQTAPAAPAAPGMPVPQTLPAKPEADI
jgi:serine protease Do